MSKHLLFLLCCVPSALLLIGCSANRQIRAHSLPNYSAAALHQIMFLDFELSRPESNKPERVVLTNAIFGKGETKNSNRSTEATHQIKLVLHYKDGPPLVTQYFEHPLFEDIEVANANGSFQRHPADTQSATLSIRFQYTVDLVKLALYSSSPNQDEQLIYTLPIRP